MYFYIDIEQILELKLNLILGKLRPIYNTILVITLNSNTHYILCI